MKNVILYVRVSTDEQAGRGYSLRDQEQKLLTYCQNNNLNVLHIFREDFSAKTFKRPEFKRLLDYCKKNKRDVHQMLFIKWDRFSRNTSESYQMIDVFNQLGIQINAIEQPLDLTIPEQGLMLAVYLSIPEVENQRRSLNVIAGMRRAFKEGRYVGNAPKGYSNGMDANKKPLLVPNEDAKYIQEGFELMATGIYNQKEVFNKLKTKGFKSSMTAIASVFRNHLYYGGVFVKAYKGEPEMIAQGIHEPIITKELFYKVQDVMDNRRHKYHVAHKKINENFPLKGFLNCPTCKKPLTASSSKGRSKHYTYYHCISPCNERYRIEDVNLWFEQFLKSITLDKEIQEVLYEMIKEELTSKKGKTELGPKHFESKKNIEAKLIRLQDLFIEGEIEKTEYLEAKKRYQALLQELKQKEEVEKDKKEVLKTYEFTLAKLLTIHYQYTNGDIDAKRKLIGSIFPEKFQFENKKVRTKDIHPLFLKISSINNLSQRTKKRTNPKKLNLSGMVGDEGFEPPTPSV
ncbi:recombinase family protein [Flavobacterium nakdongensis]|uniref:recombinase family protein n=1 Tax=Flavobacterium nakdongensis TaxID=3073563 RepID=UPI0038CDA9F5